MFIGYFRGDDSPKNGGKLKGWLAVIVLMSFLGACQASGGQPALVDTQEATPAGLTQTQIVPPSVTFSPSATNSAFPTTTSTPSPTHTPQPAILVGAGDISICGQTGDEDTARLLDYIPGTIFTAGDNSNGTATESEYTHCFDQSWGRHKDRIHPSPGNHDYWVPGAVNYYNYFGEAAGDPDKGYYSYDLGEWHIIALNSNCLSVGGCGVGTPQEQWLRADLAANTKQCTLAYWHHPRWSSGLAGSSYWLRAFWDALYDYGAEVVISGHDHSYERFAPQGPNGEADPEKGIRQFVVGTGGVSQRGFGTALPTSELRHTGTFGVLKLSLYPDSYSWEFIPIEGETFTDSGAYPCHG